MMLPGSTWLVFAVCVYASYYIFFQTAFLRLDRAERVLMTATVLFPKRVCPHPVMSSVSVETRHMFSDCGGAMATANS